MKIKGESKLKRKKDENRTIKDLKKAKKKMKKEKKIKINEVRKKLINGHKLREKQERYARKIQKAVEELRRNGGGMKEESFLEFKWKLKGKQREPTIQMKNKEGEMLKENEKIKKSTLILIKTPFIRNANIRG